MIRGARSFWLVPLALVLSGGSGSPARGGPAPACPVPPNDPAYVASVNAALASKQDVWGNALIHAQGGPSYEGVQRYLHPLMLVGPPSGSQPNRLTDSGVYYLAFGQPESSRGTAEVNLHVADGSQIVSRFVRGPTLSVDVGGRRPTERYGSCLARLTEPRLRGGYEPVLETRYVDARGVRYRQTSFATRIPGTRSLVSFVRVTVDIRRARVRSASVRFTASVKRLHRVGDQLRRSGDAVMLFGPGGQVRGPTVTYTTGGKKVRTVYVAWLARRSPVKPFRLDQASYGRGRRATTRYWNRRLSKGALFVVPDARVMNAERNLLIQNLSHCWRYSLANAYERFSWELLDVAEVMGVYGFTDVERAIIAKSFASLSVFPNRADGERMSGTADYFRRTGDKRFVKLETPALSGALLRFELELAASPNGLLDPERYGVDVGTLVYGLHDQALVLQGLRGMAGVWADTGRPLLASRATVAADKLEAGLRAAVQAGSTRLADGSLFVPIKLLDGSERPYDTVTESLAGSYWNLVMPYALASGFFSPGSSQAAGLLRYLELHGSRMLGLVRFRAYTNSGKPGYRSPGSDDVYGTNVSRFLADNEQPDQLALSLYGKLGADMTPGTFVSGEGSTIGPVDGEWFRSMFRPPNSANNAFFLETLRLMLLHETAGGLELAYSTPRAWLQAGRQIAVRGARTNFGPLSYSVQALRGSVRVKLDVPRRLGTAALRLRLRLPDGERITGVTVDGRSFARFDPGTETIDLTGLKGRIVAEATVSGGSGAGS